MLPVWCRSRIGDKMGFFKKLIRKYDPLQMNRLSKLILGGTGILGKKGQKAQQKTGHEKTQEKIASDAAANNDLAIRKGKR
jgi:hypothetical protein